MLQATDSASSGLCSSVLAAVTGEDTLLGLSSNGADSWKRVRVVLQVLRRLLFLSKQHMTV